ncbi:MAG: amidohydrolase family protein [Thermodesulfobacteriota bacterium]|nr:amidohydrolase family protein [Thermodesulfobacteriota bacterium]
MIIDFHTHIFPETICKYRERFFDREPSFKLLYDSSKAKLVGADTLVSTMDEYLVDHSVVFGFPWKTSDTAKLNNDYILEAVARYPDRLKGFACFDMSWQGAPEEAQRCIDAGLSGVGELAFYLSGIDEQALVHLEPIMDICKQAGNLPVMIHTNEPVGHQYPGKTPVTLEQIYALAQRFPDNRIVLAHWGGGIFFFSLLKREAKDVLKNIWFDTAASPFLYDPDIYRVAVDTGIVEKVLFGTDYPLIKPSRYYKDIEASGISESAAEKILGRNASALLRF